MSRFASVAAATAVSLPCRLLRVYPSQLPTRSLARWFIVYCVFVRAALTVEKAASFADSQTIFMRARIPRDKFAQNPPVMRVRAKMTNGAPSSQSFLFSVPRHLLSLLLLLLFPEP